MNVLASALRLIENLVPMDETAKPFEELLQRASRLQDRRVVANALDVLKKYQPVERNWAKSFAQHADNRISANAIVYEGLREITPFVVKKLRRMLHAKDPLHVSSAAYAIGEIAYHHKLRDAVYLKTQVGFLRLVTELVALVFDDDSRVRRQAIIAVQKIADPEVIARIEQRLARSSNNEDAQRAFGRAS
jgi:HEAT repeat protein